MQGYHRNVAVTTDQVPPVIAACELEPGARLGERYRLIARLGRGGGGAVWRVYDEKVGEELALKLIDAGTDLERWRREVALARRIAHRNVCRVYDLGDAGGLRWVTMEWIEGESLRALLRRGTIADPERLMRQLVDAVAAIHASGVVHRDLKPENIVVDSSGRAVVVDFGLARQPVALGDTSAGGAAGPSGDRSVTGHGAVLGTPRYMAPEQAAGDVADARSDLYALGLVLQEIAAGASAADANATTVSDADAAVEPVALAALPRPWGPLIARCTARAPAERPPDAVALRAALAPRRRWWLGLAGALAVAVVGGGALVLATRGDGSRSPARAERRLTATAATPANQPTSIAISHDGKTLAYTVDRELLVRSIDDGREASVALPATPAGMELARSVEVAGVLADGSAVVQILDRDYRWGLWIVGAGAPPRMVYARDERMAVAVSPRGDLLAVATVHDGVVAVPSGGGPERPLVAARAGERFAGLAWSPGGARLAYVRYVADSDAVSIEMVALAQPAAPAILVHERLADPVDRMLVWQGDDRVVYVVNARDGGAALFAVAASPGAAPALLARWPGEHVEQLAWGGRRLVVLRGTAEDSIVVGGIDRRGYLLNLERAVPEHASAGQLAGWTADGRLVHAADRELVVRAPRGPAHVLVAGDAVPESIVGDAVVYNRDGALRRVTIAGGDDRPLVGLRRPAPVRCAGDRAQPCVLAEPAVDGVHYVRFDPAIGELGEELYHAPSGRFARAVAVSPDGARLAIADGTNVVTVVTLAGGSARESLAPSARVVNVSWARDGGSLLVSVLDGGDDRASVFRLVPGGPRQLLLHANHLVYGRICEAPAGDAVALQTRELALDAWLVEGL
jgi:protein kinase-like protein